MVRLVKLLRCAMVFMVFLGTASRAAGQVVGEYTELPLGTPINLTSAGTTDWVKWGVSGGGPNWSSVGKAGVARVSPTLAPVGTAPGGTNVVLIGIPREPARERPELHLERRHGTRDRLQRHDRDRNDPPSAV